MTVQIRSSIRFLLNHRLVELSAVSAVQTLLDFLRLDRNLRGTKEGCAEGDCGACTVLVGRLLGWRAHLRERQRLHPLHRLARRHPCRHGRASRRPGGPLHPVQQAMVDYHGSQCGFCTPGFVMSLYGLWMRKPEARCRRSRRRCRAISVAAPAMRRSSAPPRLCRSSATSTGDPLVQSAQRSCQQLDGAEGRQARRDRRWCGALHAAGLRRRPCRDLRGGARGHASSPAPPMSASGSRNSCATSRPVVFISHLDELQPHHRRRRRASRFGAGVSYTEAFDADLEALPATGRALEPHRRRAGAQHGHDRRQHRQRLADRRHAAAADRARSVRRRCARARCSAPCRSRTSSSNTASRTASPANSSRASRIPFLARRTRASPSTRSPSGATRTSPPSAAPSAWRFDENGKVSDAAIAFGGMAGTPKRADNAEAALIGKPLDRSDDRGGDRSASAQDYQPLTDWRASADYRLLAAKNLFAPFYWRRRATSWCGSTASRLCEETRS